MGFANTLCEAIVVPVSWFSKCTGSTKTIQSQKLCLYWVYLSCQRGS